MFCHKAEALGDCSVFKTGNVNSSFTIKGEKGKPITVEHVGKLKETLMPVIMLLRQFTQEGEAIQYNRACNIAWKHMADDERAILTRLREAHRGRSEQGAGLGLRINETSLRPLDLIDLFYNAVYFHSDMEKMKELVRLWSVPLFGQLMMFEFQNAVLELSIIVMNTATLIKGRLLSEPKIALEELCGWGQSK